MCHLSETKKNYLYKKKIRLRNDCYLSQLWKIEISSFSVKIKASEIKGVLCFELCVRPYERNYLVR
jgi:hypothetical protein